MKTPIVHYQRCMAKISYFWLIQFFFYASVVTKYSKDPQRNGTNNGTDIIYWTELSAGLWLSASIWRWNKRFWLSFLHQKSHAIGQCNCHSRIPVDILRHFNKIVEQNNKFKVGWLVKMITCKYVFLLLLHKCLERCMYAISVLLLLYDFNFSWKARKEKVFFRKTSGMRNFYLETSFAKVSFWFNLSSKLIR